MDLHIIINETDTDLSLTLSSLWFIAESENTGALNPLLPILGSPRYENNQPHHRRALPPIHSFFSSSSIFRDHGRGRIAKTKSPKRWGIDVGRDDFTRRNTRSFRPVCKLTRGDRHLLTSYLSSSPWVFVPFHSISRELDIFRLDTFLSPCPSNLCSRSNLESFLFLCPDISILRSQAYRYTWYIHPELREKLSLLRIHYCRTSVIRLFEKLILKTDKFFFRDVCYPSAIQDNKHRLSRETLINNIFQIPYYFIFLSIKLHLEILVSKNKGFTSGFTHLILQIACHCRSTALISTKQ